MHSPKALWRKVCCNLSTILLCTCGFTHLTLNRLSQADPFTLTLFRCEWNHSDRVRALLDLGNTGGFGFIQYSGQSLYGVTLYLFFNPLTSHSAMARFSKLEVIFNTEKLFKWKMSRSITSSHFTWICTLALCASFEPVQIYYLDRKLIWNVLNYVASKKKTHFAWAIKT